MHRQEKKMRKIGRKREEGSADQRREHNVDGELGREEPPRPVHGMPLSPQGWEVKWKKN